MQRREKGAEQGREPLALRRSKALSINELVCCSELYPSSWSVLCSAWLCISGDLCATQF